MAQEARHPEYQYLDILKDILDNGKGKYDFATNTGLKSVFGRQMRYDLSDDVTPIVTTKKLFWKGAMREMLWFLSGKCDNVKGLADQGVHIWDDWAYKRNKSKFEKYGLRADTTQDELIEKIQKSPADSEFVKELGDLGPIYGVQWRHWKASDGRTLDPLVWAINKTKKYPQRKHVCVSAWNPEFTYEMALPGKEMALPPCHSFFQINVTDGKLNLGLYQRSCDMFLGVPFNIAQYALLTKMLAQLTGFQPGEFVHTLGDAHIYAQHVEQVKTQLERTPRPFPKVHLNPERKSIDDFVIEDFTIEGYDPHPPLKGDVTPVGGFNEEDRGKF